MSEHILKHIVLNSSAEQEIQLGLPLLETLRAEIQRGSESGILPIELAHLEIKSGRTAFVVNVGAEPVLLCCSCWREDVQEEAWKAAEEQFFKVAEIDPTLDLGWIARATTPDAPWMLEILLHGPAHMSDDDARRAWLISRCAVWSIMEKELQSNA